MSRSIELTVTGMNCDACVRHVTKALLKVPGVKGARVDLAGRRAEVEVEAAVDGQSLVEAVGKAGYGATLPAGDAA